MSAPLYVVAEGDSLTTGNGIAVTSSYPYLLALSFTDNRMVSMVNVATSGNKLSDMATQATTQVDPTYDSRKVNNFCVIWGGTNSMYSGESGDFSGSGAYDRLVTYCQARQAEGFKVIVLTCLPRTNVGTPAGFETQRTAFNASVRANWRTFADAMADVAADSRLSDSTDTTYFNADLVHLTATGNAVVASIVLDALEPLT